jgi:glycosyltransferase involved in cell wall biosynthesis
MVKRLSFLSRVKQANEQHRRHSIYGIAGHVVAGATFLKNIIFSTNTLQAPSTSKLVAGDVDKETILHEQAYQVEQIKRLDIPTATYASIHIKHGSLQVAETYGKNISIHKKPLVHPDVTTEVLDWLRHNAQERHLQYIAAAINDDEQRSDIVSKLWLQEDIVPYRIKQNDAAYQRSLKEQVADTTRHFDEDNIVYPELSGDGEVHPAELVTLADYAKTTTQAEFAHLDAQVKKFAGKQLVFINATPRGGGVALMRHALIRLMRLLNVDAHWYTLLPRKEAFDITKPKFHNILQAVASPEVELDAQDKEIYHAWMKENAEMLHNVFLQADVIVIDDPQPAGLIPYIKKANPAAKIIYRSHIQIVGSLASQPGTPQHKTWSFLWDSIQHADYFVSHPMQMFVPDNVPAEKVFYLPATTDPLDGLNKPLSKEQLTTYMKMFNELLVEAEQTPLDEQRPYIIQIARFDPSKGIPDLLDAYRKLREILASNQAAIPQLVITGVGSVDDPDGAPIYSMIWTMLQSEPYVDFAEDIKVVRLPHKDQILNALLRESKIVLQLSTKEGFEVKVTEALMKSKPVVAYRVGGIPLQIEDGETGYLVDVGNTTRVAEHLRDLLTDDELYERMSQTAGAKANPDYLTIPNALCWLFLANQLVKGEPMEGNYQWVKALAEARHNA